MAGTGQGVNILRYTALTLGLLYGVSHQSTLKTSSLKHQEQQQFQHKEDLIGKAKAEWARKQAPASTGAVGGESVISDPENPKFDLEAWIKSKEAPA